MLRFIRDKFHPLFYLRRFWLFQQLTRLLDLPIAIRFPVIRHPVYVSLSKNLAYVLTRGRAVEEDERRNFINIVQSKQFRRFFDIGSNFGLYGFLFLSLVDDGFVTMFEPDEDNARLIRRTITRARLRSVALIQAAVCDREGVLPFFKDDLTGATGSIRYEKYDESFLSIHHHYRPAMVQVQSVALDRQCADGDPDFLKIDVEGAELSILRGGVKLIERTRPAIFLECDRDQAELHAFLSEQGYVFLDFASMRPIETLAHNTLALHRIQHQALLSTVTTIP